MNVNLYFRDGELAEWSIAAVLKTVDLHGSAGSNPPLSAFVIRSLFAFAKATTNEKRRMIFRYSRLASDDYGGHCPSKVIRSQF